jgi:hypothetical protein
MHEDRQRRAGLIRTAFEVEPVPPAAELCGSRGSEAHDETAAFAGKPWPELEPAFVEEHAAALFFFTPEAFHYYLPAFLMVPLNGGDIGALAVHNVLFALKASGEPAVMRFRRTRWPLLTKKEIAAVEEWLDGLLAEADGAVFAQEIAVASRAFRERFWWKS